MSDAKGRAGLDAEVRKSNEPETETEDTTHEQRAPLDVPDDGSADLDDGVPSDTMDRGTALCALPAGYAVALALRDEGLDEDAIAERLGLDRESMPALLELAHAKLTQLLADRGQPEPREHS